MLLVPHFFVFPRRDNCLAKCLCWSSIKESKKARKNLAAQLPSFWNHIITPFHKSQGRWLIQGHDIFASKVFSEKRGMLQRLHLLMCSHDDSSKRKEDGEPYTGSKKCAQKWCMSPHISLAKTSHMAMSTSKGVGKPNSTMCPSWKVLCNERDAEFHLITLKCGSKYCWQRAQRLLQPWANDLSLSFTPSPKPNLNPLIKMSSLLYSTQSGFRSL